MATMRGSWIGNLATYVVAIPIAGFFLIPIVWLISLAVRTQQEIFLGAARFIPENPTLDNFTQILTDSGFLIYLGNSLKLSALGALGAVVVSAPAAYAFSRFAFKGRSTVMMAILAVQMISGLVILIPLYRYMGRLGLLESHFGVTAIYIAVGIPLSVWLLKNAFDGVPIVLEEAASIDGYGPFETFLRITLPLSAPGIASAFILNMILNWSQFLIPFIMLTEESQWPISVAIYNYAGSTTASTTQLLAAACLIATVPAILAFLILQRSIVSALTAGAVDG